MDKPQDLGNYLEVCRRLGIRYIDPAQGDGLRASPVVEARPEGPVVAAGVERNHPVERTASAPPILPAVPMELATAGTAKDRSGSVRAMELTAFEKDICGCLNCPLGKTRNKFVFGSGDPEAEVMFIGEAPGADEDAQGLPFVGAAGQLLTRVIASTKTFDRSGVFICNVLKCRPPGNRTPQPEEVEQCRPYLEEQIHIVKPRLIMAMGAVAAQTVLKTRESVGKLRNRWHDFEGIPVRVTYHPAALLRFEGYKKDVWEDMKVLTNKYLELTKI